MKLFGSIKELVSAVFRKDTYEITLKPSTSVTYTGPVNVELPAKNGNAVLVSSGDIVNADINASAGIVDTKLATIATAGKVSNSATTATDANTASAIVARDASGNFSAGTITASLSGNASTATTATSFSGSLSGEVTGTQSATVVASGVIDNDNISATAGIVDTKLATISTAGKVSNSATTATSSNTASAIVARDGSGNFSAGTVSASGVNVSGLTASQAVITDGSKNLSSIAYTAANTGSTLMSRDVAGSTSVNTLSAANIDVTGLATMDKAYIDGSTGNGFIEFEGQTVGDVAAPTAGEARLFAGTDGKIYVRKAGSSQAEELGAGGSGEINLVDNSSDAGSWGVVNATATTNTTAANNPLAGTIDSSIAIASSTLNGYARYRFSMPAALKQRKLKLEWFQIAASLTSGAYKVEVYTNASSDYSGAYTELALSTDSAGTSSIPNLNGKYSTTFDTNGSDYYEIRLVRTAASAATIYLANVVCGPGIQPQGAVVGPYSSYAAVAGTHLTATTTNPTLGTVSSNKVTITREGSFAFIEWTYVQTAAGSAGSGTYNFVLPSGLTIDTSITGTETTTVGAGGVGRFTITNGATDYDMAAYVASSTTIQARSTAAGNWSSALTASNFAQTALRISLYVKVPIAEWAGSGTVQLAQNDVTYYYGTGGTWGTSSTLVTAQGPGGVLGGTTTPAGISFQYTIVPTSPIQQGSQVVFEVSQNQQTWYGVPNSALNNGTSTIEGGRYDGTNVIGASVGLTTTGNILLTFGKYATGTASPWSGLGTWYWRVRVVAAGAAVGFGLYQPGVSAGLVSSSGLAGRADGNAIASGYVGEMLGTLRSGTNGFTYSTRNNTAYATSLAAVISITLNRGVYLVSVSSTGGGTNSASYWGMQGYVRVGGTQVSALSASSTFGPNTTGGPGLSVTLPLVITADSVAVDFYGQATSAGSYTTYNEMWAVRLA